MNNYNCSGVNLYVVYTQVLMLISAMHAVATFASTTIQVVIDVIETCFRCLERLELGFGVYDSIIIVRPRKE